VPTASVQTDATSPATSARHTTALASAAAATSPALPERHVTLRYWDKWTGFEKDAMQAVVDAFNATQSRIFVDFLSVSEVVDKTMLATAGGIPPDVAGVWAANLVEFADKNALLPLDDLARATNVNRDRYLPGYWNMGLYKDHLWGVPTTPTTTGLYWNKRLFRAAGLDPERPPRTFAELDEFARKLTTIEGGHITQMGFMPSLPSEWPFFWINFFGGQLWDGGANITLDAPANLRAFEWIQSYPKRYGPSALQDLSSGFGNFASPQDPFLSGRLAMVFQGVWLASYIRRFAPGMEYGAAPFPVLRAGAPPVVYLDSDMLVIPRGAAHPAEAFEFIRFVSRQSSTEMLNLGQEKTSPLRDVSADFFAKHRHPYIRLFQDLASSPGGVGQPRMSVWWEYRLELENVFQRVWLMRATPAEALGDAQIRMQKRWDQTRARQNLPAQPGLGVAPLVLTGLLALLLVAAATWRRRGGGAAKSARGNASLLSGLSFFSPWAVGLLAFLAYPLAASMVYSLCDYSVLTAPRWVGAANFFELFTDEVFWVAARNTVLYVLLSLPLGLCFALFAALLLDAGTRGTGIYRTLMFVPSLIPVVASAVTWTWIFNSQYGVLNNLLHKVSFGLVGPLPWLADPRAALPSLALMSFWSIGQAVVILLAAMQDVPTVLYEAADLDGAGWWQKAWHITLPLTSPVILFNVVIGLIGGLQLFTQPFLMTEGGPARATLTYTMRLYQNAFVFLRMGYASAMVCVLFLITIGVTILAIRLGRKLVHEA
jgi:ABC-type sugar transport system permease subunit/ABC-type glycerol-3-phosphate transport system substrate-binding protein